MLRLIGARIGLSALSANITPTVAAIGTTGFIVGFVRQNTLFLYTSEVKSFDEKYVKYCGQHFSRK